jgi:hypothetical protein
MKKINLGESYNIVHEIQFHYFNHLPSGINLMSLTCILGIRKLLLTDRPTVCIRLAPLPYLK